MGHFNHDSINNSYLNYYSNILSYNKPKRKEIMFLDIWLPLIIYYIIAIVLSMFFPGFWIVLLLSIIITIIFFLGSDGNPLI